MRDCVSKKAIGLIAVSVISHALTGCATYQKKSTQHLESFKAGNSAEAIAYYQNNQAGKSRQLFMVEAGRLLLLEGDFLGSHSELTKAIDEIFDLQEGSIIRLKDIGGIGMSSTFLDDRMSQYNLPAFETVFTLQQQALNSIFMGNIEAAEVELRRAVYAQDLIAEEYEKNILAAQEEATKPDVALGMESVNQHYASMGPVLGRAKSGFQNPYVWFFSGLAYELNKDEGNAYIAYKKAWELVPDNVYLQRDLLRLAGKLNKDEFDAFQKQFSTNELVIKRPTAEIVIIYEEGFLSQRFSVGIPVFVLNGFHKVTFPVYNDGPYQPGSVRVVEKNAEIGKLMPLCYVQSLAYHDLKQRIPGIAARNISRAITREVTKQAAARSDNNTVKLIGLLAAGIAPLADEADTRGWYSLPMIVQHLREPLEPGDHNITLVNSHYGQNLNIPLTISAGETKLIWVADQGVRASYCVASLTHPAKSSAQYAKVLGGTVSSSLVMFASSDVVHPAEFASTTMAEEHQSNPKFVGSPTELSSEMTVMKSQTSKPNKSDAKDAIEPTVPRYIKTKGSESKPKRAPIAIF